MDTDGRREDTGRGVRKLQTRWSGLEFGNMRGWRRSAGVFGAPMAAYSGCGERDGGERTRQEALADRTGASLRDVGALADERAVRQGVE